jgi:hypothetical protein
MFNRLAHKNTDRLSCAPTPKRQSLANSLIFVKIELPVLLLIELLRVGGTFTEM